MVIGSDVIFWPDCVRPLVEIIYLDVNFAILFKKVFGTDFNSFS